MSKDRIEGFIQGNREAFDTEVPNLGLWAKIDQELHPPKPGRRVFTNPGRWAAGLVLLLGLGWGWYHWAGDAPGKVAHTNVSPKAIAEQHPEMAEIHEYFNHEINKHKGQLAAMNHHDPALYRDLQQLEAHFDTLYWEWTNNSHKSNGDKLVDAMIANYQHRHQLLERVVYQLEAEQPPVLRASQQHPPQGHLDIHHSHGASRPKGNPVRYKYYSYEEPYTDMDGIPVLALGHLGRPGF